jgi:hypothetical protein
MSKTIWAYCSVSPLYNQETAKYVSEHWGIELPSYTEEDMKKRGVDLENKDEILGIVVRNYPQVVDKLAKSGYFKSKPPLWQVNRISEQGVTLYLVNHSGMPDDGKHQKFAEVFVFIPMNNVIVIHNATEQFFINESVRAIEEKAKEPES